MTNSLLELSAKGSARTIFQRTSFPKRRARPSEGEEGQSVFLQMAIGREIRSIRARHDITAQELATSAGISAGMLSKVENGSISPSLSTLHALSTALGVPLSALFPQFGGKSRAVLWKADGSVNAGPHDTRTRYWRTLPDAIGCNASGVRIQPCLITLSRPEDECPAFHRKGTVFLYMLEGEMVYLHDGHLYRLTPGDSLLFDAEGRHGPEELACLPVRFLSVGSCPVQPASGVAPTGDIFD